MKNIVKTLPNSMDIVGEKYHVEWKKDLCDVENVFGRAYFNNNKIVVQEADDKYSEDKIIHTYFHEWLHIGFYAIGEESLSENDKLVDILSGIMSSIYKQSTSKLVKEYENEIKKLKISYEKKIKYLKRGKK